MDVIRLFHGAGATFASGAFSTVENAEAWILEHRLTGVLAACPVDTGVFEWVIARGLWEPTKPHHRAPELVGGCTSAHQDHRHYENGRQA